MDGRWGRRASRNFEGEGRITCGRCACENQEVDAGGRRIALRSETAYGASGLGNRTLGSLGGCAGGGSGDNGCSVATASAGFPGGGGFWGRGGKAMGKKEEGAETFSKDSSRFSPSSVPVPVKSRSMQCAAPTGAESSASEESETEWGGTWRWRLRALGYVCAVDCGEVGGWGWGFGRVGSGRVGFCGHQHGVSGRRGCRGGNGEES